MAIAPDSLNNQFDFGKYDKGSGLVGSFPSDNNGLINPINPSQQTENFPSATNITPIGDGSSISNNQFDFDKYTNQFDFSKYKEGFREYRKQHPLSREPESMVVASNLPGIGNLEPNASKILSEYLNMVAPDYYNQYLSANKRNGPVLGSLPGDINTLQQTENVPSITNITPIGGGGSMGSINANNATNYNSLLQPQFPAQSIFNTINPANNQIQSSQQNGISQRLQPISQAQPYQLPPTPQPVSAPSPANLQMAGSNIAYIPRPTAASYSPDNLPEFMRNFTQVTPQTFAPSQGVFDIAPVLDSIQGTMPQNYISEYQPLEQAYQESIAVDPSMFGGAYRSGLYMPTQTLPAREGDGAFDIAESLAAVAGLKELYPYAEEAIQKVYDPVEEFVQQKFLDPAEDAFKVVADPTEEFVQQNVFDPIEDVVKIPLQATEEAVAPLVSKAKEIISPIIKPIEENIIQPIKETLIDPISDKLSELINSDSPILDSLAGGLEQAVDAYSDIQNLIENPSGQNAENAVNAINEIGQSLGSEGLVVPPAVGEALFIAANISSIANAIEDPTAENLTNAYASADDLVMNLTDAGGLPAGGSIGSIGQVLTGLEALEGGIESPAEAVNVVNAANLVSGFASNLIAGQGVGAAATGAAASGFVPSQISNVLGPIGTFYGIAEGLKAVSNLAKGGAAGEYPRVVGNLSFSGGRIGAASNVDAADVSEDGLAGQINQNWAQQTFDSATQMTNDLIDNYGFELDQAKAEPFMKIQSNAYYNREGKLPANAPDFVVKLLQSGALKPTENTPPEVLSSNEAFGSFLDSHLNKGQDLYAAKMYDISNQAINKGVSYKDEPLFGAEHAASAGRTTNAAPRSKARFATQESAQNWIDSQTPEQIFYESGSGNNQQYFVKKPSYSLKKVDVKGKTFYEINRSENSKRIGGKSDNMSELKLKYADKYKTQEEAQKLIEGLDKEEKFVRKQSGKYPRYYVETPVYSVVQSVQNGQPVYSVSKNYDSKQIKGNSLSDAQTKYEKEKQAKLNPVQSSSTPSIESLEWYISQFGPEWGPSLYNISGLNLGSFNLG